MLVLIPLLISPIYLSLLYLSLHVFVLYQFLRHGSLLFLICNDLLQRDLGIKPTISNFVELLPKFGYFFLLIIVHTFFLLLL